MAKPWLRVSPASLAPRLPSVEGTSFPLQASNHSSTDAAIRDALLRNGHLEDVPSRVTTPAAWLDDRITLHRLHWSLICQERGIIIAEPSTKVAKYPVLFLCMYITCTSMTCLELASALQFEPRHPELPLLRPIGDVSQQRLDTDVATPIPRRTI